MSDKTNASFVKHFDQSVSNSSSGEMEDQIIFEVVKSLYQTNKVWHNY